MTALAGTRGAEGFSLIELLASAAIVGLLASIAVPFIETTVRRQKEQALRVALRDIRQGLDAYRQAGVAGQLTIASGKSGYPPSLTELTAGLPDQKRANAKLYFLRRIPRDPFCPDAGVAAIDSWGLRSFESSAEQPKKGDDVYDVYSTSTQTGLNGVPYKEW
ncbi:type II secretion system protein [Rugamonas sp. CCM 8940]|uniref:type II secretion system protein n=1 Tax=Rugamonas sp. CCM 8940 TaxID=2765359 RepID=UPI0018F7A177|nr:type II secretion system protein [Rugamonas sp. CCM 8940]MBJ7311482.1 type II secretion system protein [Rugamonas sp. CCM 8940]